MNKLIVIFAILALASSRLLLPRDVEKSYSNAKRFWNPSLKTSDRPESAASTAKPVQGISNAYSGYLSVNDPNSNSKLFYIFYECRNIPAGKKATDIPIVIWLQGGPGASSIVGNFFENGPYGLTRNNQGKWAESKKQNSWNDYYNYMPIDNPRGTGYSIADKNSYVTSEDEVAADFVQALVSFYGLDTFKDYLNTPLYVFGESYAGHYIPSIGKALLQHNSASPAVKIPVQGIAVGDGWTDPINQLAVNDVFGYSLGLLDDVQKVQVQGFQTAGQLAIRAKQWAVAQGAFGKVLDTITTDGGNVNVYNFRDFGDYDFSRVDEFMNYQDTCTRYNVDSSVCGTYVDENVHVYEALSNSGDFMSSVADRVAYNLNNGLRTMLYNGQDDIICNSPNQQNWVGKMNWNSNSKFYDTPFQVWEYANKTVAGLAKNTDALTFVIVNKAGHLSPMDQINTTTEMVRRFISNDNQWNVTFTEDLETTTY